MLVWAGIAAVSSTHTHTHTEQRRRRRRRMRRTTRTWNMGRRRGHTCEEEEGADFPANCPGRLTVRLRGCLEGIPYKQQCPPTIDTKPAHTTSQPTHLHTQTLDVTNHYGCQNNKKTTTVLARTKLNLEQQSNCSVIYTKRWRLQIYPWNKFVCLNGFFKRL